MKDLTANNVFDIARIRTSKALNLVASGLASFDDLACDSNAFDSLSEKQQLQVPVEVNSLGPQVDKAEISEFLDSLWYPLYFLDFETFQEAIPSFDNQKPYEQMASQFSLHWIEAQTDTSNTLSSLAKRMPTRVVRSLSVYARISPSAPVYWRGIWGSKRDEYELWPNFSLIWPHVSCLFTATCETS